jgi:hypothetical protein
MKTTFEHGLSEKRKKQQLEGQLKNYQFNCNSNSGAGVQFGPLGTSATNWSTVPGPGDYEDGEFGGMKIGRGNQSTR